VTGGKYLELLKEAVPKLTRVAVMLDPAIPGLTGGQAKAKVEDEARRLGLTLTPIPAQRPDDVEPALARVAKERPGALWVVPLGSLVARVHRIIGFATRERLPTIFPARFFVEVGGLMSYGGNREDFSRRAASYVDRILKGAKPANLPVEEPTKYELVINLKTAKALGLTVPPSLLARADQVIE